MTLATIGRVGAAAPRWLTTALVSSLALNLILIGTAVGFVWRHAPASQSGADYRVAPNLLNYVGTLPAPRAKALMAATDEQRQVVRPLRQQLREVREETVRALTAEPFDKVRFREAQERLLVADRKAREAVFALYAEMAAQMSPQERRAFVSWQEARRKVHNLLDGPEQQAEGSPAKQ